MDVVVADIINIMAEIAPPELSEDWDNVGLQAGRMNWPVKHVRIALDPLVAVVKEARDDGVDMLVTHHPLIFRPMKRIDFSTPTGEIIALAAAHRMAIFSAHTNLDSAEGGMNDYLSEKLGLKNCSVFQSSKKKFACKLVIYAPVDDEDRILSALFEAGAGKIGAYTKCSFRGKGKGTFEPAGHAKPFIGKPGRFTEVEEVRIETLLPEKDVGMVLEKVKKAHPYETMAYDVYGLKNPSSVGIGRIGQLEKPLTLHDFATDIKQRLGISSVRVAGDRDLPVRSAAISSGSGSSLMKSFLASSAQAFVSGDLHYHDARDAEQSHRGLIDIGHFASEHIVTEMLSERLRKALNEKGLQVTVDECRLEKDPFRSV